MNKKIFAFLSMCLFSMYSIGASSIVRFADFSAIPSISFGMGNDRWSNGFSHNLDDQKSFSLSLAADWNLFQLKLNMDAMTDKASDTRYDLLSLICTFPLDFPLGFDGDLNLGTCAYGDLGMQATQNLWHRIMGIYQLSANYPDVHKIYPMIGTKLRYNISLFGLGISPYVDADVIIPFSADEEVGLEFCCDSLSIFCGYRFMQSFIEDGTLSTWMEHRRGLQLGYRIEKGVFRANYFTNPVTRQGYGDFMISLFSPYIPSRINYSFGKAWYLIKDDAGENCLEHYNAIEFSYRNIFISTHFNTGNSKGKPMDNGILSVGYRCIGLYGFEICPSVKYAHFMYQRDWIVHSYFGCGLELRWGYVLFEHYKLNAFVSANYLLDYKYATSFGFNIELL